MSIKRRSGGVARGLISPPPYKAPVITRQELIQTQTKGVLVLQVIHEKPEISINRYVTTFFPRPPLSELLALVSRERGQVIHLSEVNLKGRVAVPKRMNLRKNFKRHLTPIPHPLEWSLSLLLSGHQGSCTYNGGVSRND